MTKDNETGTLLPTKNDRLAPALERLRRGVEMIQTSEGFRELLRLAARFHHYSWRNWLLIFAQCPQATRVAGYRAWQELGRQVRRGEKAIRIIAPIFRRQEKEDQEKRLIGFREVNVFDLQQTEGEPLPRVDVPVLEGSNGCRLYEGLLRIGRQHFTVIDDQPVGHNAAGYWNPAAKEIRVDPLHSQLQRTKTLAHELAHALAGHGTKGDNTDTREAETVAEAVAFLVCDQFGLDTSERSFPYVALFSRELECLVRVFQEVERVARTILGGLEEGPPR